MVFDANQPIVSLCKWHTVRHHIVCLCFWMFFFCCCTHSYVHAACGVSSLSTWMFRFFVQVVVVTGTWFVHRACSCCGNCMSFNLDMKSEKKVLLCGRPAAQYTIHTGWIRWITNSELHGSHYRTLNCLPTALWYGKIFNKWKQKNFQYKPTMEKLLDGNGTAYSLAVTTIRCCHSLFVRTHRSAVVPRITVNNISQAHV